MLHRSSANTDHFNKLNKALTHFVTLTAEQAIALRETAMHRRYEKDHCFVRQGEICHQVGFLVQGVFRVFHLHADKEISNFFNTETRNPFVSSFASLLGNAPSKETVVALEDSDLLVIEKKDLLKLYDRYHTFERLGRLMAEYNYLLALQRIEQLQYLPAAARYQDFLKTYPNLINRIPHHYVASYLGVTPESLSRIRNKRGR
jgi:CRP-like cAMP-binding protein